MSDFILFPAESRHLEQCPALVLNNYLLNETVGGWMGDQLKRWFSKFCTTGSLSPTWELVRKELSQALLQIK